MLILTGSLTPYTGKGRPFHSGPVLFLGDEGRTGGLDTLNSLADDGLGLTDGLRGDNDLDLADGLCGKALRGRLALSGLGDKLRGLPD